ncbi:MAG TPA: reverse transcriptase family protein, partial [Methylophilaceae bacterium]|nr:reverse transcriptase family protein [Methylophilaceae bacterium]
MKKNGNHLCYNHKPITSLEGLALALKMNKDVLCEIAGTADKYWRQLPPIIKSDGKQRLIFDARPVLKAIHGRINKEILSRVVFPEYITGGVKGRDYTANARFHIKKVIVITEDIQSFFPSTNSSVVYDIWKNFFKFSPEVASLLTLLTTKEGTLPQGGKCSPYLANLVFWDKEPLLFEDFKGQGLQ